MKRRVKWTVPNLARVAAFVAAFVAAIAAGCTPAASTAATPATTPPAAAASLPPSPTPRPTPTSAPTLPAGVAWLRDGHVEPGTYRFAGFEPAIQVAIDGDGWEVGHFHDDFFDLFLDGDFPAIGFGRFVAVLGRDGTRVPASGAEAVIEALRSNPDLKVDDVGPVEIAGLIGRTVDIRATREQTPLFSSGEGGFKFDPGFVGRFHVLDVEGGAMEILIAARDGELEAAIEATQPILDSLEVLD